MQSPFEYIDGWSHPESDFLIWELERGARVVASLAIPRVDDPNLAPDTPDLLHAFLLANQWSAVNRLSARREEEDGIDVIEIAASDLDDPETMPQSRMGAGK